MHLRPLLIPLVSSLVLSAAATVLAQDKGTVEPKDLPPLDNPSDPKVAAKELFARKLLPTAGPPRVIGACSNPIALLPLA